MVKFLAFLLFSLLFTACTPSNTSLYFKLDKGLNKREKTFDLQSSSYRSLSSMCDKLEGYPLIFIGDHHNQDDLHQNIKLLIDGLQKKGKRIILASEWFTPSQNKILKAFTAQSLDEASFLKKIDWKKRIGFSYESFKPIYETLIEGKGDLVGINLTKKEQKKISERDFDAMSSHEKSFFKGLDLNVSIHHDMLKPFFDECHAYSRSDQEDCSQRMYRVQVAWESKMAQEVHKYFKKLQKDEVLMVLAGSMHLENGLGINLRFSRLSHQHFFTLLPRPERENKLPLGLADGVIFYKPKQ